MPPKRSPNNQSRITPLQALAVVVFILISAGIYELTGHNTTDLLDTSSGESSPPAATALPGPKELPATAAPVTNTTTTPADGAVPVVAPVSLPEMPGKFDYLVLSLSWSPDYCATSGNNDPQQCSIGKKLGFVLHGLWPQNNTGYPSDCSNKPLPASVKTKFPGLYPNQSLYDHEWSKHGTCTGLSPEEYLQAASQLKQSVIIPASYRSPEQPFRASADQLKQAFAQANISFDPSDFEPNCSGSGRFLKELYVCFSRQGQPTECGAELHKDALKSCGQPDFLVRNIR